MCGIVGLLAQQAVSQELYDALTIIQHRGQDAAGMMTMDGHKSHIHKANGLVRDVFSEQHIAELKGALGIGHVRYPTAGTASASEAQPFYVNSPLGLAIAHNGNLVNAAELRESLRVHDLRHLNTDSDSEVLLNVFAYALRKDLTEAGKTNIEPADLFNAVRSVMKRCQGGYAAVVTVVGYGMLAFRDPHAIRPLVWGKRANQFGSDDVMVASETMALDAMGFKVFDDVAPGEAVFIDLQGNVERQQCWDAVALNPCLFEYVYLARQDSVIDHVSVYQARLNMGKALASKIEQAGWLDEIDVVIPIPDTSRNAALVLAQALDKPYREGFVKNRYIGRTFIMPGQAVRRKSVRQKLNAMQAEFEGKAVLLVDDSIVRGTTSKEVVQMIRDVGATKVFFASLAPEIYYPNVYGIDMPAASELVAHQHTLAEIEAEIGVDALIYQDFEALKAAVNDCRIAKDLPPFARFEDCVFTGNYLTGQVDQAYLDQLATRR